MIKSESLITGLLRSKLLKITLFMVVFAGLSIKSYAQEDKFKALYIYNFTKYMKWPDQLEQGDFVVGIVGNSGVQQELEKLAQVKKVKGTRNLVVKQFNSAAEVTRCHILFITAGKTGELPVAVQRCDKQGILIVTDGKDLAKKGACVNFVLVGANQKFELNEARTQRQGILVASKFKSLAILVN